MPTLRLELLKSREEEKNIIVEKRIVHSNKFKLVAGYSDHAAKLKYTITKSPDQEEERSGKVKRLGILEKISANEIKGSMITSLKSQTPHSPSESDSSYSFSTLESSSSSCKSETSGFIKRPLPPASSAKPSPASLAISLGTHLGAQPIERWDSTQLLPETTCKFSKAIHEKLHREESLHDGFLEFNFLEGRMVDSHHCRKCKDNHPSYVNSEHHRDACVLKHESTNIEIFYEDWADGLATPVFYSASARSPETSSETSHHSGDAYTAPSIDQELKDTHSIRELISQHQSSLADLQQKRGALNAEFKQCQMEAQGSMDQCQHSNGGNYGLPTCVSQVSIEDLDCDSAPFEADVAIDRVLQKSDGQPQTGSYTNQCEKKLSFPRTFSWHLTQRKYEEGFSFQTPLLWKGTCKQGMTSCQGSSVEQSTSAELVSNQNKETPEKVFLERHPFSIPMFGRSVSSTHGHTDRHKATNSLPVGFGSFGSIAHAHDDMKRFTKEKACSVSPLPLSEIKFVENADEFTPLSPLSLSEASYCERYDDYTGKEYVDMAWLATSKTQPPLHSPSKTNWDWRSKSLGARASLRSAVRNLEAAFVGSRSVSLPKTRSQTHQKDKKSESSKLVERVFVSPIKGRHKHAEILKPIQRPPHPGGHVLPDPMSSGLCLRRDGHADSSWHSTVGCAHPGKPITQPLPLKSHQKHKSSDLEFSCKPFLPASRSAHCLTPSKGASGQGNPFFSATQKLPDLATSQPNVATPCMLQGYLQCIVRDSVPCYTLTINDSEEMLLARACAFENYSSKEGCKLMYTFHSGRTKSRGKGASGWRSWIKKDNKTVTDLAGKMQVSSLLCSEVSPTGEMANSIVSEFVLFDGRAEDPVRSQSLRFLSSDNACQNRSNLAESPLSARNAHEFVPPLSPSGRQASDIPRSPSSARMSSKTVTTIQPQAYSPMKGTAGHQPSFSFDVWSDSDLTDPEVRHLSPCPSHLELAAIVIQIPTEEREGDNHHPKNGACRRGLKFLNDTGEPEDSCSVYQTQASGTKWAHTGIKSWKASSAQKTNLQQGVFQNSESVTMMLPMENHGLPNGGVRGPTSQCVTMMLPMEHHGLPNGGVHGPTSLIERWKCGGKCDCGGWDLGCGMKVFSSEKSKESVTSHSNTIHSLPQNQPLNIYSQGKTQEVVLSLGLVQEGFFMLNFQRELSPLKAFATSVAILHSRESLSSSGRWINTDHLETTLPQSHSETRGRSDSVSKDIDGSAVLEVNKDIPAWCASNPPLSPFGRV